MSGVGITGKIKPKDGGAFPVFEDVDGQGGMRCVTTIAERNTFSAAPLYCKPGMQVYVEDLQCVYELAHDLATWTLCAPSPRLALQTDWYVSLTGSANADGKTLGTAITQEELQRRLFPNCSSLMMRNDVTIHVAAGPGGSDAIYPLQFFSAASAVPDSGTIFNLIIDYEISSSAPMTLTGVVQPSGSTHTRGRLTVGAGSGFVNQERIRLTSGVSVGAMAYSTGLVSANPLDTFCDLFGPGNWNQFHIPLPAAIGDTVVADTLHIRVGRVEFVTHPDVRILVKNARIVRAVINGACTETGSADNGGNVFFSGCNAVSIQGYWQCNAGGATVGACRWEATTKTTLQGDGWLQLVSCVQGWQGIIGSQSSYGMCIDGGALFVGAEFTTTYAERSGIGSLTMNRGYVGGGSLEVENGPGPGAGASLAGAVTVFPGSQIIVGDLVDCEQWGASTPYAIGYVIYPGGNLYQFQPTTGTIAANFAIPSVVNIDAGGELFAYSDNEVFVPNQNCGLHAIGTVSGMRSYTDAQFYLTAQSGNKSVTTFTEGNFIAGSGLYRVSGYVSTTTADAGAIGPPALNVVFTDDSGVERTVAVATAPSVTTLGGAGGEALIEVSVATAQTINSIRWSVTGVVSAGSAQYSARMRVEKVSSGL